MPDSKLSKRQRECLELVREGYTSKEIARLLNLSPLTIDNHIKAAISMMGANGRADAARKLASENTNQKLANQSDTLDNNRNYETLNVLPVNKSWKQLFILPSLWGSSSGLKWSDKVYHIFQICVTFTLLALAIILVLKGIMALLD